MRRALLAAVALLPGCTVALTDVDCGEGWAALSAGGHHTLGLRSDGSLVAWGSDEKGQSTVPAGAFDLADAGYEFGCASGEDGTACWGDDGAGQVSGAPEAPLRALAAGGEHACGLDADGGTVACWGRDDLGQVRDAPRGAFARVAAGSRHACAVDDGGAVTCWGDPAAGQPPAGLRADPETLAAGFGHTCALDADGEAVCWGALDAEPAPGPFVALDGGTGTACGVRADGALACWGADDFGAASPPVGRGFVGLALGLGGFHGCAIDTFAGAGGATNTRAACWGLDASGQADPPPPPETVRQGW